MLFEEKFLGKANDLYRPHYNTGNDLFIVTISSESAMKYEDDLGVDEGKSYVSEYRFQ